jgi:Uma2 family endonuclease
MEVVSGEAEDRHRDLVTKRRDYARAGIPEYWIVDPQEERMLVLRLAGKRYVVHGEFPKGTTAASVTLRGFTVDVTDALSAASSISVAAKPRRPRRN